MKTPIETIRAFYAAIEAGDTGSMIELMAPDIERISVVNFNVQKRGPEEVMKKVFAPLMQEWESFSPAPSEFLVDGSTVVSLGRFLFAPCNSKARKTRIRTYLGRERRKDRASSSVH